MNLIPYAIAASAFFANGTAFMNYDTSIAIANFVLTTAFAVFCGMNIKKDGKKK